MSEDPAEELAGALSACGVDPQLVKIERDDLCQEDVLTIAGESYPDATLACLAKLYLTFPSRFVFANGDLQRAFEHAVETSPTVQNLKKELQQGRKTVLEAAGLSTFPAFNTARESLAEFAVRVEVACGFGKGELLSARGAATIFIEPARPAEIKIGDFEMLLALLDSSAPGIRVAVVGSDAG